MTKSMTNERNPFFTGYKPQFYFKKPACTCALHYFQAIKCPVHSIAILREAPSSRPNPLSESEAEKYVRRISP